jgi:uncharacterized iron-regulated membrane protein
MKHIRLLHSIHRWCGLITGINILILSLTGAYLVFIEEIAHAFKGPDDAVLMSVAPDSQYPIQTAIDALLKHDVGGRVPFVFADAYNENILIVGVSGADNVLRKYAYNKVSGSITPQHDDSAVFKTNRFILQLHANLFAAYKGIVLLGVVSIVFLVSTITGFIIYTPFMKQAAFGRVRLVHGSRMLLSDVHKLVGVTSLGFNVLMAVTGLALTLGNLGIQQWYNAALKAGVAAMPPPPALKPLAPPVDVIFASAAKALPQYRVLSVIFPGAAQGEGCYLCYHNGSGSFSRYSRPPSLVGVESPYPSKAIPMPLWVKLMSVFTPLHFGNFAGTGIKIAYCLFGITSGILAISGVPITLISWWKKLRKRLVRRRIAAPLSAVEEILD